MACRLSITGLKQSQVAESAAMGVQTAGLRKRVGIGVSGERSQALDSNAVIYSPGEHLFGSLSSVSGASPHTAFRKSEPPGPLTLWFPIFLIICGLCLEIYPLADPLERVITSLKDGVHLNTCSKAVSSLLNNNK